MPRIDKFASEDHYKASIQIRSPLARRIRLTAPNPTQRISRSRQITSNMWAGRPILAAEANLSPNPEASREHLPLVAHRTEIEKIRPFIL
jgi:hypothetical protein